MIYYGVMVDKLLFEMLLVGVILFYLSLKNFEIEKELGIASIRAFIQIFAIALLLGVIISINHPLYTISVLGGMMLFAAHIARKRVPSTAGFYKASVFGVSLGSTIVIIYAAFLNIFPIDARYIIPFGSMVIANAMNSTALGLNRLIAEVKAHRNSIESKLSLGVPSNIAVKPHVIDSVKASLIPAISTLEALGLVWIPGTMSGMILGGADPIWAAQYQLFVSFSIFTANTIASIAATYLATRYIFTKYHQFSEEFLRSLI